jgi:hypothetical protein
MLTIVTMIIAIIALLAVAEIPYFTDRSHVKEERPIDPLDYDYYHYMNNHR